MKAFKEYLIDKKCLTPQTVYMTQGAEVVSIQDTDKGLMLVTIITPTNTFTELRTFKICASDENIYTDAVKYIGSFNSFTGVRYVIEFVRED